MKPRWISETDVAAERVAGSFPPFGDPLADRDGKIAQVLAKTRITPLWATEWQCRKGWSVGPRIMSFCVWFVLPDNQGWVRLPRERKIMRSNPGDLILLPEGIEHAVGLSGAGKMRQLAGHFKADVFGSINLLELLGFPVLIPSSKDAPFQASAERMVREYAVKAPGWQNAMSAELTNLLLYVVRERGHLFHPLRFANAYELMPKIMPVLEKIEKNLPDHTLSPSRLAGQTHISAAALRKLFKIVTGMPPATFIQRCRVDKACEMLRFTREGIKEIAVACGFAELNFFYRVFKRWTGMTPANFRGKTSGRPHGFETL